MKVILLLTFPLIGSLLSCESKSQKQTIEKNIGISTETTDSIKVITYKELLFTLFNREFNLWYSPKLIINSDTFLISGVSNDNGSDLSIQKSPNGNFFIMDNIIKGYVENGNGEKILHENFTCVIVNVYEAKVEQSLQSDCDGSWNSKNEWVSAGNVIFTSK